MDTAIAIHSGYIPLEVDSVKGEVELRNVSLGTQICAGLPPITLIWLEDPDLLTDIASAQEDYQKGEFLRMEQIETRFL